MFVKKMDNHLLLRQKMTYTAFWQTITSDFLKENCDPKDVNMENLNYDLSLFEESYDKKKATEYKILNADILNDPLHPKYDTLHLISSIKDLYESETPETQRAIELELIGLRIISTSLINELYDLWKNSSELIMKQRSGIDLYTKMKEISGDIIREVKTISNWWITIPTFILLLYSDMNDITNMMKFIKSEKMDLPNIYFGKYYGKLVTALKKNFQDISMKINNSFTDLLKSNKTKLIREMKDFAVRYYDSNSQIEDIEADHIDNIHKIKKMMNIDDKNKPIKSIVPMNNFGEKNQATFIAFMAFLFAMLDVISANIPQDEETKKWIKGRYVEMGIDF